MSTELARSNGHGLIPQRKLTAEQISDGSINTLERATALRVPQALEVSKALASINGRPLGDRILVLPLPKDDHYGSILIPQNAQEEHVCGIVVSVGRGRFEHGAVVPPEVRPGNYVSFSKYSARKVSVSDIELYQITEQDITFAAGEAALPVCGTTMTPRLPATFCMNYRLGSGCGTYSNNLGPCEAFELGGNGRCVYCDHALNCHPTFAKATKRGKTE